MHKCFIIFKLNFMIIFSLKKYPINDLSGLLGKASEFSPYSPRGLQTPWDCWVCPQNLPTNQKINNRMCPLLIELYYLIYIYILCVKKDSFIKTYLDVREEKEKTYVFTREHGFLQSWKVSKETETRKQDPCSKRKPAS